MDAIDELLTRGVANIIPSKAELEKVLRSGQKLNVFLGIDPTATRLHLGNAARLRQLQRLVDLGHHVTFLIGDFTALIGDTSDKESERPVLTKEQISSNFQEYQTQAAKLVDFSQVKIVHNSDWLGKLTFEDIVRLCQQFTLNDFISRELIKKRFTSGGSIRLDEVLYPIMQGYDSYFMDTDLQIGGTDQTFNMQAGRILQRKLRNKESFVLSGEFLEGTDGRKMSKSWGNAIWLDDSPEEMFGKVMSLKDELIQRYFLLATNLTSKEIPHSGHPMELKKQLAHQIVLELYDSAAAGSAQQGFESTFQQGHVPENTPEFTVSSPDILDVLVGTQLAESKSAARRLIAQGGVTINGQKVSDLQLKVSNSDLVQVGPRQFAKIKLADHS